MKDFVESVKNKFSRPIKLAILQEVNRTFRQLPTDIEEQMKELQKKDREMFPETFEKKEFIGYSLQEIVEIIQRYKNELENPIFFRYKLINENIEAWLENEDLKKRLIEAIHSKEEEEIKNVLEEYKMLGGENHFGGFDEEGIPYLLVQLQD